MPKRIRVFFINCPTLAADAAAYLILAQNKAQKAIQFEVLHFWIFGNSQRPLTGHWNRFLIWLQERLPRSVRLVQRYRSALDLQVAPSFSETIEHNLDKVRAAVDDYDKWFLGSGWNSYDSELSPAIVITETPLAGHYLTICKQQLGFISLADWKEFFKPGSALEYILANVQRLSLRLCYGSQIGSHFPTRGCIWDFDVHQPDIRIAAFLGSLCETCKGRLKQGTTDTEFSEIEQLISNEWIGRTDDPFSVAAALVKNYKYELRKPTGLTPGLLSSISQSMRTEVGKFFFDILKWVLILIITLLLASYFPGVYKLLQPEPAKQNANK